MNILVLSPFAPYPLDQGGKIRVFNIIKYLSRDHRVTLACFFGATAPDLGLLNGYCEDIIAVERAPNLIKDMVSSLLSEEPFNYTAYSSDSLRSALHRVLEKKTFDLVQIEFSTMWQYADLFKGIPVVLDAHNLEYEIIRQVREFYKSPLRKLLYSLEEKKLRFKEEQAWRECRLCFTVSDVERQLISLHSGLVDKTTTIPNGVDLERFPFTPKTEIDNQLLFLGGMRFQPNLDSARYLLKDIWPAVRGRVPDAKLDIVGSELWRLKGRAGQEGTAFLENVPDVLPYFRRADVLLVPLRYGAGTRVKILEAMAAGLPVVTTSKGCEGLEVVHKEHMLIADSPEAFASAVSSVLGDFGLRKTMVGRARKLVEKRYSWEVLVKQMEDAYSMIPGSN